MKGSTTARQALADPLILQNLVSLDREQIKGPLKDVDFMKGIGQVRVSNKNKAENVVQQSARDARFLRSRNFMDYSVLLFIVYKIGQKAQAQQIGRAHV